jgi:hypothetical protein
VKRAQAAVGAAAGVADFLGEGLGRLQPGAAAEGPKVRMPAARVASATPAASGASGPTMTKSMAFSSQKVTTTAPSRMSMSAHSASIAMPALPGATISRSVLGFCFTAQASACSRPPPPRMRMFMPGG